MSRRGQGLLAEIERDALDDRVSLAMTLRKCVALGGQTRIAELRDWASSELSGFRRDDEIPEYRTIHVPLKIDGLTVAGQMRGQQISAFELPDVAHDVVSEELKLAHGVGDLQGLVRNAVRSGETSVKLSPAGSAELMTLMNHQLQGSGQTVLALYWDVSIARIDGVLEQIRTTLVRLVSEMRATMADDESMPSSEQAAQAVNVVLRGGKRHSITFTAAQAGSGGTAHIEPSSNAEESGWTKAATVWVVIGVLVAIVGVYIAYRQWHG